MLNDNSRYMCVCPQIYCMHIIGISPIQVITYQRSTGAYHHMQGKCTSAWLVDGKRAARLC